MIDTMKEKRVKIEEKLREFKKMIVTLEHEKKFLTEEIKKLNKERAECFLDLELAVSNYKKLLNVPNFDVNLTL